MQHVLFCHADVKENIANGDAESPKSQDTEVNIPITDSDTDDTDRKDNEKIDENDSQTDTVIPQASPSHSGTLQLPSVLRSTCVRLELTHGYEIALRCLPVFGMQDACCCPAQDRCDPHSPLSFFLWPPTDVVTERWRLLRSVRLTVSKDIITDLCQKVVGHGQFAATISAGVDDGRVKSSLVLLLACLIQLAEECARFLPLSSLLMAYEASLSITGM